MPAVVQQELLLRPVARHVIVENGIDNVEGCIQDIRSTLIDSISEPKTNLTTELLSVTRQDDENKSPTSPETTISFSSCSISTPKKNLTSPIEESRISPIASSNRISFIRSITALSSIPSRILSHVLLMTSEGPTLCTNNTENNRLSSLFSQGKNFDSPLFNSPKFDRLMIPSKKRDHDTTAQQIPTLLKLLRYRAMTSGDQTAVLFPSSSGILYERCTYKQLDLTTNGLAEKWQTYLQNANLIPLETPVVALDCDSSFNSFLHEIAFLKLGFSVVLIPTHCSPSEMKLVIKAADVSLLAMSANCSSIHKRIGQTLRYLICVEMEKICRDPCRMFRHLSSISENGDEYEDDPSKSIIQRLNTPALHFIEIDRSTGAQTSIVTVSNGAILTSGYFLTRHPDITWSSDDVILNSFPQWTRFGQATNLTAFLQGCILAFPLLDSIPIHDVLKKAMATFWFASPSFINKAFADESTTILAELLTTFKMILCDVGEPISIKSRDAILKFDIPLTNVFGDAETGPYLIGPFIGDGETEPLAAITKDPEPVISRANFTVARSTVFDTTLYELLLPKDFPTLASNLPINPCTEKFHPKYLFRAHDELEGYFSYFGNFEDVIVHSTSLDGTLLQTNPLKIERLLIRHPLIEACCVLGMGRPSPCVLVRLAEIPQSLDTSLGDVIESINGAVEKINKTFNHTEGSSSIPQQLIIPMFSRTDGDFLYDYRGSFLRQANEARFQTMIQRAYNRGKARQTVSEGMVPSSHIVQPNKVSISMARRSIIGTTSSSSHWIHDEMPRKMPNISKSTEKVGKIKHEKSHTIDEGSLSKMKTTFDFDGIQNMRRSSQIGNMISSVKNHGSTSSGSGQTTPELVEDIPSYELHEDTTIKVSPGKAVFREESILRKMEDPSYELKDDTNTEVYPRIVVSEEKSIITNGDTPPYEFNVNTTTLISPRLIISGKESILVMRDDPAYELNYNTTKKASPRRVDDSGENLVLEKRDELYNVNDEHQKDLPGLPSVTDPIKLTRHTMMSQPSPRSKSLQFSSDSWDKCVQQSAKAMRRSFAIVGAPRGLDMLFEEQAMLNLYKRATINSDFVSNFSTDEVANYTPTVPPVERKAPVRPKSMPKIQTWSSGYISHSLNQHGNSSYPNSVRPKSLASKSTGNKPLIYTGDLTKNMQIDRLKSKPLERPLSRGSSPNREPLKGILKNGARNQVFNRYVPSPSSQLGNQSSVLPTTSLTTSGGSCGRPLSVSRMSRRRSESVDEITFIKSGNSLQPPSLSSFHLHNQSQSLEALPIRNIHHGHNDSSGAMNFMSTVNQSRPASRNEGEPSSRLIIEFIENLIKSATVEYVFDRKRMFQIENRSSYYIENEKKRLNPVTIMKKIAGLTDKIEDTTMPSSERCILLTGATGYLGCRLLVKLINMSSKTPIRIIVLLRGDDAEKKLTKALKKARIDSSILKEYADKYEVITNAKFDATDGRFGLSKKLWESKIVDTVTDIVHLAWYTKRLARRRELWLYEKEDFNGLRTLLGLHATISTNRFCRFTFASDAEAIGWLQNSVKLKSDFSGFEKKPERVLEQIYDENLSVCLELSDGYAQSKFIAELMIQKYVMGLEERFTEFVTQPGSVRIIRMTHLAGDRDFGTWKTNSPIDFIIRAIGVLGIAPILESSKNKTPSTPSMEFLPVDIAADGWTDLIMYTEPLMKPHKRSKSESISGMNSNSPPSLIMAREESIMAARLRNRESRMKRNSSASSLYSLFDMSKSTLAISGSPGQAGQVLVIHHLANMQSISWYEFLSSLREQSGLKSLRMLPSKVWLSLLKREGVTAYMDGVYENGYAMQGRFGPNLHMGKHTLSLLETANVNVNLQEHIWRYARAWKSAGVLPL